jgi:hypothetical protein
MNYAEMVTILLGLLTLFSFALLVIFGLTFSEGKTTHPIYRNDKTQPIPGAGQLKTPRPEDDWL